MKLKLGADPEVFATKITDGFGMEVISPALLEHNNIIKPLKVDKEYKHPVYIDRKEYSWMMDGVAFELTLHKAYENPVEMFKVILDSLDELENFLNHMKFEEEVLDLWTRPVVEIDVERYRHLLDNHRIHQGFIFGCDEDQDAIDTKYKCVTLDVQNHPLRYGGGHLHFSGIDTLKEYYVPAIKLLAIFVGNFCVAESLFPDLEKERSKTYGRPGRYRVQNYKDGSFGIEYRTPSNCWLNFSTEKFKEMIEYANNAINFLEKPSEGMDIINTYLPSTIDAIINSDQELSKNILRSI